MTLAFLWRWGPWIAAALLALGLMWALDARGDAARALATERATNERLTEDLQIARGLADNLAEAGRIQADISRIYGARLASIDARLSLGLESIADAPDSTQCAASAPILASERVVRGLVEADAHAVRAAPRDDAERP